MTTLRFHRRFRRGGFSLVEILVAVAILALLATIGLLVASKARKSANKSQLAFQLQTIAVGLDAYNTDFNGLPVTSVEDGLSGDGDDEINRDGVRGARLMCKALMGACGGQNPIVATAGSNFDLTKGSQDGKEGPGFALPGRSGIAVTADAYGNLKGKSYGPYLSADKFHMSNTDATGKLVTTSLVANEKYDDTAVLLDANNNVILFYPVQNPQAPVQLQFAHVAQGHLTGITGTEPVPSPADPVKYAGTPMYVSNDNSVWLAPAQFRKYMGDANGDGRISGAEVAAGKGKYVLWSAGPDGVFGPNANTTSQKDRNEFDDVTNFQGE